MKKISFKLITLLFSCAFLFSCVNFLDNDDFGNTNKSIEKINITGKISVIEGAVPSTIENAQSAFNANSGRMAIPTIPNALECYFFRTEDLDSHEIDENAGTVYDGGEYHLALTIGRRFKVTAGISSTYEHNDVLLSTSWETEIVTRENAASFGKNICLEPKTTGTGTVSLSVTVDSSILRVICQNEDFSITGSGSTYTLSQSGSGIPCGSYDVTLCFYYDAAQTKLAYYDTQKINVFPNLLTDKWVTGGSSVDPIDSTGKYEVTSSLIKKFARTQIYVGNTTWGNASISGDGSPKSPYLDLSYAFDFIKNKGDSSVIYTIWVSGLITGTASIPADINSTKAIAIKIFGTTGNATDILNGNGSGTVLTINSTVPVTIGKLKITGGNNSSGDGGGIRVAASGTTLTLSDGALITGNTAKNGGGIHASGCNIVMTGNAKLSSNISSETGGGISILSTDSYAASFTMSGTSSVTGCEATSSSMGWGGGIYAHGENSKRCTITLSGNVKITGNKTREGAGIGLVDNGDLTIKDSVEISGNIASNNGGGLRAWNSTITMTGGVVKNNRATNGGGGISVNKKGFLTISGSAYIPYGADKKNDVHIIKAYPSDDPPTPSTFIKIDGTLTPPAEATDANGKTTIATITPELWKRGFVIVQADGTNITDLTRYKEYFDIPSTEWEIFLSTDKKALTINSPIYIASSSPRFCTKSGNDNGRGERASPYATIARACAEMTDETTDYIVFIDGTIASSNAISGVSANSISITGANGRDHYTEENYVPTDCFSGNNTRRAFTIESETQIHIANLKITGGKAGTDENGGGIIVPSGATLTVNEGCLITGNTANDGGGIYNGGTLYIKGGIITGNTATGNGGGVYNNGTATLENAAVIGTKYDASGTEPAIAIATATLKSNFAEAYGGGVFNALNANFTMDASLTESNGGIYYNYSNNIGGIENFGTLTLNGGVIAYNRGKKTGAIDHGGNKMTINGVTIAFNAAENAGTGANKASGGVSIIYTSNDLRGETEYKSATFNNNIDGNTDSTKGIGIYVGSAVDGSTPTVKLTGGTFTTNTVVYLEDNCYLKSGSSYYSQNITFELQSYTEARLLVSPIDRTVDSYWTRAKIMNNNMEVFESYSFSSSPSTKAVALYKLDKVTEAEAPTTGYSTSEMDVEGTDQYNRDLQARYNGNFYIKTSSGKYGVMRFPNPTRGSRNSMTITYSMLDWENRAPQSANIGTSGRDLDGDGKKDFYIRHQTNGNVMWDKYYFATDNGARYMRKH